MAKLIYCMIASLDGYVADADGRFDWGYAQDLGLMAHFNRLMANCGTYLYGRRIYDTMVFWETLQDDPAHPPEIREFTRLWRAADKIVYSTTLTDPQSARTRIVPRFDPDAIRALKATSPHDITINGPTLAAQALRAGLVDEVQLIACPILVGGGTRFFPDDITLTLSLQGTTTFANGVVALNYTTNPR